MAKTRLIRASGVTAIAITALAVVTGCSGSSGNATAPTTTPPVTASSPATPAGTTPSASFGDLSGKWSGTYSGQDQGSFTLTWVEKDGKLVGQITVTQLGTVPLNGRVTGSSITFGTVGSTAITYKGSVSGDAMSGTWYVGGVKQGDWSAHRA
jgi:hypothetical protein